MLMKTRFRSHSLTLLALMVTGAATSLTGQVMIPRGRPSINQPPQIRVQSPLLGIPTNGDAARAEAEKAEAARAQAELDKADAAAKAKAAAAKKPEPKQEAAKAAKSVQPVKMKEPAADAPAAASPASQAVLLPGADGAKPMPLTPEKNLEVVPLPPLPPAEGEAGGALDPNINFIPKLKGIYLFMDDRTSVTGKPSHVPTENPVGITLGTGLNTPAPEVLTDALRAKYLGKGLSFNALDSMVKEILAHYSREQRPTTHVYIPEQEITETIKIAVLEGRLGEARYVMKRDKDGNAIPEAEAKRKWYQPREPKIPKALEAQRGEILNMNSITQSVTDLNVSPWARLGRQEAHPYRRATVSLTPTPDRLGYTNAELDLESRVAVPIQAFAGWDNTGTVILGENRFNVGSVWYDAFNTGYNHQLGFQAQSAEDYDLFHAIIASYQIPIPSLRSTFQMYGAFMQSSVDIPAAGVTQVIEGDAWILGGRWFYRLPDWYITASAKREQDKSKQLALYHEIGFGFDYKNQENNLFFGGVNVFPTQIEVAQYAFEYNLRQTDKWGETTAGLAYFYSPGSITRNNTDANFLTARTNGTADYSYIRGNFTRLIELGALTKHLNDFKFLVRGTGQWSTANLIASEQLGLGGYDSVRGYPERTMRGDKGLFIQTELYSPAFHPLRWLAKKVPDRWMDKDDRTDELRLLVFYDYGWADVFKATAAEPGEILNASSIGVGLRYRVNKSVTFRFDYGYQLEKLDPRRVNAFDLSPRYSSQGDGYAHMGLSLSF